MPPKARIIRKTSATGSTNSPKSAASSVPPSSTTKTLSTTSSGTGTAPSSKEGAMLPPPDPSPQKAILEPELDALAISLRNVSVKTSQVHAFFADVWRLGINTYVPRPPHALTDSLSCEIEKYDQICDMLEAQLSRAIAVLQRDLDRARAQEQAEREAEALRNMPPPESEVVAESNDPTEPSAGSPSSVVPMDMSGLSASGTQKSVPVSGQAPSTQRVFPHKLDLTSDALRISPGEFAQGLGGSLPSPVTLAPKSGRTTATSEFPPDFMAALAASTRPVDIDLTMLPEEAPTTAYVGLDPSLGSADRPIELDLEAMDIDMANVDVAVDVDVKTLFGDESTSDMSTANLFGDTTSVTGNNAPSPGSLLATFSSSASQVTAPAGTSGGEPPFDMSIGEMSNIDFSQFQFDPMTGSSDMGNIDMLLGMDSETGNQAEGQGSAGDT
ncbi:hypothetical protein BJV78DRAFT_1281539 [Lactifluus subvellereus]|nr:hypothetical protein BJV78DRAFT_1281539 [Lactifluus subvellereus]